MTTEEQIQTREAWSSLRNLAQFGLPPGSGEEHAQQTAKMVRETIRPLLKTAYDAGRSDCRENPHADDAAKAEFRDLSVTQIMDALGLGLEA